MVLTCAILLSAPLKSNYKNVCEITDNSQLKYRSDADIEIRDNRPYAYGQRGVQCMYLNQGRDYQHVGIISHFFRLSS